ncbi:myosin-binding protein C, cardiac-type-like isoform X4 [Petromyzon marinus]|uniref:Myosin-binding protein H n=1 Tax=Petromyzon marinus TaxID=7757 RepID=A0AAJ7XJU0_PETMA|nr:myosin-binding protein C, cardiac-type-like isoform X4 [Petromyzon marinus]
MPVAKKPVSPLSQSPQNVSVPLGHQAEFSAETTRVGTRVSWRHGDKEIRSGDRVSIKSVGKRHTLTVAAVTAEDCGSYSLHVGTTVVEFTLSGEPNENSNNDVKQVTGETTGNSNNDVKQVTGETTGNSNNDVKQDTEEARSLTGLFLTTPQDGTVTAGDDITFSAQVDGSGSIRKKPQVRWFKGKWMDLAGKTGKHLTLKETVNKDTKVFTFSLCIIAAKESFSGSYRCEVVFGDVTDSWGFNVSVIAKESQTEDIRAAFKRTRTGSEDAGELDFSALLKKRDSRASLPAEPEVDVWEILKSAKPCDYEKIALQHGITDLRGMLTRLNAMKKRAAPPKASAFLSRLPPTLQAMRGERVRLVLQVRDRNTEVTWLKKGKELRPSGRVMMEALGDKRVLVINKLSLDDDAEYSCRIGDEICSLELFVQEPPVRVVSPLDDQSVLPGQEVELECELSESGASVQWLKDGQEVCLSKCPRLSERRDGRHVALVIADAEEGDTGRYTARTTGGETACLLIVEEEHVSEAVADVAVKASDQAVFRCMVADETVGGTWIKNGEPVEPSQRVHVSHEGRVHMLVIDHMQPDDEADYSFIPDGHALYLSTMLGMIEVKVQFVPRQVPPKIHLDCRNKMLDNAIVVIAGNKLRLDVPVTGDPEPTVTWYKEGEVMASGEGRVMVRSYTGGSALTLQGAERGDGGRYAIAVDNPAGVDSADITITVLDIPDPPSAPTISDVGDDVCTATWEPPHYNGGAALLGYVVERKKLSSRRWMKLNVRPWAESSMRCERMVEGVAYQIRVCAVNPVGTSLPGEPSRTFVPLAPPGPPSHVTVEAVTDSTVTLRWRPPERGGAGGIDGYHLEYRREGEETWVSASPCPCPLPCLRVSGLSTGDRLQFRVSAVNRAGHSAHGHAGPLVVREIVERPKIWVPRYLRHTLTRRVGDSINILVPFQGKPRPKVTWSKDGEPLDPKQVSCRSGDTDTILFVRSASRGDSGLYQLRVEIDSLVDVVDLRVQVIDRPGPPVRVEVLEVSGCSVSLRWDKPRDTGNSDITGYSVDKQDTKSMEWFKAVAHVHRCSSTISGLVVGNFYNFRVFAHNDCGSSLMAGVTPQSTLIPKPGWEWRPPPFVPRDPSEAPSFTQPLSDVRAVQGFPCLLTCSVRAHPKPHIAWFRGESCVSEELGFRSLHSQGVCTLEVRRPGPALAGCYSCRATNGLGEASTSCQLTLRPLP